MNDPQPEGHKASHIGRRKFLATLGGAAVAWPRVSRVPWRCALPAPDPCCRPFRRRAWQLSGRRAQGRRLFNVEILWHALGKKLECAVTSPFCVEVGYAIRMQLTQNELVLLRREAENI
jgi:hypothetical protein